MGLPLVNPATSWISNKKTQPLNVHLFSKHLQFLSIDEASKIAANLGFSGLDLTVRPKGHVLPENINFDLPKAIVAIKKAGIKCDLITTAIESIEKPVDQKTIRIAAQEGVKFYRMNWYNYPPNKSMETALEQYRTQLNALSLFNKKHSIVGCYQNHAGVKVGSSFWEIKHLLEEVDPNYFGTQYDIRHAIVDGGKSWPNGFRLLKDHIKTIVAKDFKWEWHNGKASLVNVPLGEGMVDFKRYFQMLKAANLCPPVSLHLEYPLGGAEKGKSSITVKEQLVFDAMQRDLNRLQNLWIEA